MKDIILVIALLVAVSLSVFVVRFAQKADKAGKSLEEERYSRMVAEETLEKKAAEMASLQMNLKEDQDKMVTIVSTLDQEKGVNSDLKKQYDELTAAKADLEAKLQTVLHEKAVAVTALRAQAQALAAQAQVVQEQVAQPHAAAAAPTAQAVATGH